MELNPLFDPTHQSEQGPVVPEYEPGKEIELSEINAEKALEFAINAAAGGQQHAVAGMFQAATVIQNQANLWMQLHDRLIVKEGVDALNRAFSPADLGRLTNRDLISEVRSRADKSGLFELRGRTTDLLAYANPEELDWAPE